MTKKLSVHEWACKPPLIAYWIVGALILGFLYTIYYVIANPESTIAILTPVFWFAAAILLPPATSWLIFLILKELCSK